jgi:hypothetical protein
MKLVTKEIERKLPKLYSQEHTPDPLCVVKFFNPTGSGTWYAIEGEKHADAGGDYLFFGWVSGLGEDELGYFNLPELAAFRGRFGLGIERDLWFTPTPLSVVQGLL